MKKKATVLTNNARLKRDPLGVRFDPIERAALEAAAARDDRPLAAMARKAVVEWLRDKGYLNAQPQTAPP